MQALFALNSWIFRLYHINTSLLLIRLLDLNFLGLIPSLLKIILSSFDSSFVYSTLKFCALELCASSQVDPKTFRADTTWLVVCVGCSRILSACLKNNTTCTAEIAYAVTAACRVATAFLEGSRSLGLKAKEASMAHELILGNASMRASAEALSSNARLEVYPSLQVAATKLAQVFNPDFQVQSDSIAVVNQSPKDDDTMSAGQNNSTGIIVEDADPMTGLQVRTFGESSNRSEVLVIYASFVVCSFAFVLALHSAKIIVRRTMKPLRCKRLSSSQLKQCAITFMRRFTITQR